MGRFKNKVVWITGASSGIGEALVYAFDKEEAKLIISARRSEELERVKQNCLNKENIQILLLDLALHSELENKAKEAMAFYSKIDILVNNGGISQRALALDTKIDVDKRIMDINYFGNIILSKNIVLEMKKSGGGTIVVTSSLLGKFGTAYRTAYAASKHALHGFYDSLRSEVYKNGVHILLLVPGYIKTNVSVNALTANGSPANKMDEGMLKGLEPAKLAEVVLRAILKNKEEILIGSKETLGVYIKRFFPKFFSKFIRKQEIK